MDLWVVVLYFYTLSMGLKELRLVQRLGPQTFLPH
jgi:hypothetical protein